MVSALSVAHAERLLAQGASEREAARQTGLAPSTIGRIKRREVTVADRAGDQPLDSIVVSRCPGCGGMQLMPCLVCRDRSSTGQI